LKEEPLKYFKELDGLRGIAALMVMFFHFMPDYSSDQFPILNYIHKVSVFGQTGVTLFFVLSGFLITRILINAKNHSQFFRNFYLKRTLRIFPLYYLFLIIYYFIVPYFKNIPFDLKGTWIYWVYLQNFSNTFLWNINGPNHFWSLAVEEHFYLLWPIIVYFCNSKKLFYVIIGVIICSIFVRFLLIYLNYGTFYFTFTNIDSLAIGALLALNELKKVTSYKSFIYLSLLLLTILIISWVFVGGKSINIVQYYKPPLIAFFYCAIIGIVISTKTYLNILFNFKAIKFTGKISYGLYVYHPLCFSIISSSFSLTNLTLNFALSFSLSYIVASLSYYYFEIYFIRIKNNLKTDRRANST
jgi:peptidoglycan/LPS O-acetylase OafA/YrhL